MLRLSFVLLLVPALPAWAQDQPPRLVFFAGIEWSTFTNVVPLEEEGQSTTGFEFREGGIDIGFGAEVAIVDWLAAGVAYEGLSRLELQQSFDVDEFRGFTNELNLVLDPRVTEVFAAPSWSPARSIRATGMIGVGFWRADEDATVALSFAGDELSRRDLDARHNGTSLVLGAGVDIWAHRRFGVRVGYKYLRLTVEDVQQPVHNLRALALFGFRP